MLQSKYHYRHPDHLAFLRQDAQTQLDFFQKSLSKDGGFDTLDYEGGALEGPQELHTTTRLVHSFALAKRFGFKDCDAIIDAGMDALFAHHTDKVHGGYFWSIDGEEPADTTKLAYGHVFVLLAGASAKMAGHADADALIADVTQIIDTHFWDDEVGLLRDEFTRDWTPFSKYRGMNANMHGVEAFLAAFEASGNMQYLKRAGRILEFFVGKMAPQFGWRIPEHYNEYWEVDRDYEGNPMFRPRGATPGHSFELGRLLLQYGAHTGVDYLHAATSLIETAYSDAQSHLGGLIYTLTLDGKHDKTARYWWPVTEAIGAFAKLYPFSNNPKHLEVYHLLWAFADDHLIDHEHGGWFPELDVNNLPKSTQFNGKPDIYHALQAEFISLGLM